MSQNLRVVERSKGWFVCYSRDNSNLVGYGVTKEAAVENWLLNWGAQ